MARASLQIPIGTGLGNDTGTTIAAHVAGVKRPYTSNTGRVLLPEGTTDVDLFVYRDVSEDEWLAMGVEHPENMPARVRVVVHNVMIGSTRAEVQSLIDSELADLMADYVQQSKDDNFPIDTL